VRFADALPKTRSGKIMRRLLKEIASGKAVTGDTTTLEDLSIIAQLTANND
jgi:acetyl-CoA synthetase